MYKPKSNVTFGPWTEWKDRPGVKVAPRAAGVYLLAYFSEIPVTAPNAGELPREVIYVGDSKDLKRRPLRDRHNRVHKRFLDLFGKGAESNLYVSVAELYTLAEDLNSGAVEYACQRTHSVYLESRLAWEFAQRHGQPPVMQVKDRAENGPWVRQEAAMLKLSPLMQNRVNVDRPL